MMMKLFSKILNLIKEKKTDNIGKINLNNIWYTTSTISNEFPQTTIKTTETAFDIYIHEDDYRQNEFLNISSLSLIQEEFKFIKEIWTNHSKKSENYTLFKNCNVREIIGSPNLNINLNELKTLLKCNSTGQVVINGEALKNGFAITTANTTYFGTLSNETITELCLAQWDEYTKNEIFIINKTFNLLFVNWHHCDLIEHD